MHIPFVSMVEYYYLKKLYYYWKSIHLFHESFFQLFEMSSTVTLGLTKMSTSTVFFITSPPGHFYFIKNIISNFLKEFTLVSVPGLFSFQTLFRPFLKQLSQLFTNIFFSVHFVDSFVNFILFALLGHQKLDDSSLFKPGALHFIWHYFDSPQRKYFCKIKIIFALN